MTQRRKNDDKAITIVAMNDDNSETFHLDSAAYTLSPAIRGSTRELGMSRAATCRSARASPHWSQANGVHEHKKLNFEPHVFLQIARGEIFHVEKNHEIYCRKM